MLLGKTLIAQKDMYQEAYRGELKRKEKLFANSLTQKAY